MRYMVIATAFVLGCTSPIDPTPDADRAAQPGEPIALRVGDAVALEGRDITIVFLAVVRDSRCPTSVTCVWAGDGAVELRLQRPRETVVDTLHTLLEPSSARVGGIEIRLTGLAPYPAEPGTIPQDEYLLSLTAVEVG